LTSLHYTLIALGIGLVAVVMIYNVFQERRSRKQAERIFNLRDEDVSLGNLHLNDALPESRIEPSIELLDEDMPDRDGPGEMDGPAVDAAAPSPFSAAMPTEAAAEAGEVPAPVAPPARPATPAPVAGHVAQPMAPESPLDGEVEYVARLRYTQATAILFAPFQETLRRISKPIRMVGRRDDGAWEPVLGHSARPYDTIELGLLLADRSGPVSEVQLDAFHQRLYEFAAEHGGAVSCQDKAEAVERARTLDAFCAEVDMLIGLNVIPPADAGSGGRSIRDLATQAGLVQGVDGTYSLRDEAGRLLFTLTDGAPGHDEAPHGVTLLFDVPRVAAGLAAFDRMTALGLQLAERLGGRLVDDGGRPVSRASLDKDRKSLEVIYARMAARGIPAGGDRALRLFA